MLRSVVQCALTGGIPSVQNDTLLKDPVVRSIVEA